MELKYTKENITLGYYITSFLIIGILYELYPSTEDRPNLGIATLVPVILFGLIYFCSHLILQILKKGNYIKCILIHSIVYLTFFIMLFIFTSPKK